MLKIKLQIFELRKILRTQSASLKKLSIDTFVIVEKIPKASQEVNFAKLNCRFD